MTRSIDPSNLLLVALTLLSLTIVQNANAAAYTVGVAVGNSFTYQISTSWNTTNSPFSDIANVKNYVVKITGVSTPIVNGTITYLYGNGSTSSTSHIQVNVTTGKPTLYVLIPAGLNAGDSFPIGDQMFTLNSSIIVMASGSSRTANLLNFSFTSPSYSDREGDAWDKATGILLSRVARETISGGQGVLTIVLTDTNVWSGNILGLPQILFYGIIATVVIVTAAFVAVALRGRRRAGMPEVVPPPGQPHQVLNDRLFFNSASPSLSGSSVRPSP